MIPNTMKGIWGISIIASVLILGFIGVQDVYAPDEQPENLSLGGNGYNFDEQAFEIKFYVHVHRDSNPDNFQVSTTLTIFQKDGTIIADGLTSTDRLPERVKEGGNNSSIHKLTAKIPFPKSELPDDKVKLFIEAELVGSDAKKISGFRTVSDITLKRG